MSAFGNDCPFFLKSTCSLGDRCPNRHCESAKTSTTVCTFWRSGRCTNYRCTYRHSFVMNIHADVDCYWEKQPGGCRRGLCPFKHTKLLEKDSNKGQASATSMTSYSTIPLTASESAVNKHQSQHTARNKKDSLKSSEGPQYKMAAAISPELTCPVCLELFEDPVTLACMHSYCRHCLESILKSSGGKRLHCPECRLEATMTNDDLQKMPRNFTLANIVAKYERVEYTLKIPCDLCDKKPPSYAVKSCSECKISYCGQCLFLHPKKGVLATHSLVDPQKFESDTGKKLSEKFCMKCILILKYEDDKEYCQHDHPAEIMDIEEAKTKIMADMLEAYIRLDDRNKKYLKELQATEAVLNDVKIHDAITKATIEREMNRKCEVATEKAKADFQKKIGEMQELLKRETKTIKTEYDEWRKETQVKNEQFMKQLQDASGCMTDVIAEMQSIFEAETSGTEVDFEDLMKVYMRMNETEKNTGPCVDIHNDFNLTEKLKKVRIPSIFKSEQIQQISTAGRVRITGCSSVPRKREEGASVTVNWWSAIKDAIFEIKFKEVTTSDVGSTFTVSGIRGQQFTEERLRHITLYDVTVSIQDNPSSESESKRLSTLPGVPCDEFQFSSSMKHARISLSNDNRSAVYDMRQLQQDNSTNLITKVWVAAGNMPLRCTSNYWESLATFNLRGIEKGSYAAAVGICTKDQIEAVQRIAMNSFFYGVAFGKANTGSPEVICIEAGVGKKRFNLKPAQTYTGKIGFYFDSCLQRLVLIDVSTDSILYITEKLKQIEGKEFEYYPICDWDKKGDAKIEFITGTLIHRIPSFFKHL